jgi:arylsulfatase A-like enzyme
LVCEAGTQPADSVESTQMGQAFAAALEMLERLQPPFLMWVHLRGMGGSWDAPRAFRESLADDEDPVPPDFVEPPNRVLADDVDPDEILGVAQAYAGQVMVLDACLFPLLEALESLPQADRPLLVLTSPRGYPLGEHGRLGPCGDGLSEEVLHLPLLLRHPAELYATQRLHSLVQLTDLAATLARWFGVQQPAEPSAGIDLFELAERPESLGNREGVVSRFGEQESLRTRAWFFRQSPNEPPKLYAKPDDRWEVNEVADRRDDVVQAAMHALTAYRQWLLAGSSGEPPRLSPVLLEPAE